MKKLFIFPYNGNGLEALNCIEKEFHFEGFIDDTPEKLGKTEYGHTVFPRSELSKTEDAYVLAVPGSAASFRSRKEIIESLGVSDRFTTIIHPHANVSPMARIGKNVLIMAGVVITSNAIIEDHVCILPNTVIHHDTIVKKYSIIGSNVIIAGGTVIGENCYIGSGSNIIDGVQVGDKTLVGLGTNVIKDIAPDAKVVGNPARLL